MMQQHTSRWSGLPALALLAGLALLAMPITASAQNAPDIGVAASVVNKVDGTVGQRTVAKATGDKVYENEVIKTGADSKGQLLFRDETALTVGPNSEVTLDKFVYNPNGNSSVSVRATRGVFRFVSGSLPSQAYEIKTPAGTLGVRGSIGQVIVLVDGTVILRVMQGSFVYDGPPPTTVGPGQVLILRPGLPPEVRSKLTNAQLAMLAPIDLPDQAFNGLPELPDLDKIKNLRDLVRKRGGHYEQSD